MHCSLSPYFLFLSISLSPYQSWRLIVLEFNQFFSGSYQFKCICLFYFIFLVKICLGEGRLPHTRVRASHKPHRKLTLDLQIAHQGGLLTTRLKLRPFGRNVRALPTKPIPMINLPHLCQCFNSSVCCPYIREIIKCTLEDHDYNGLWQQQ